MLFTPDKIEMRKDKQVRFMLRDNDQQEHEFVLGTIEASLKHAQDTAKHPDVEHDHLDGKRLPPPKKRLFVDSSG
jgi:uncharacterized cupredoxin-like copper-binding protein